MKECYYCKSSEDLAVDMLNSLNYVCPQCVDTLESFICNYLEIYTHEESSRLARLELKKLHDKTLRLRVTEEEKDSYMKQLNKHNEESLPVTYNIENGGANHNFNVYNCYKCDNQGNHICVEGGTLSPVNEKTTETIAIEDEDRLDCDFSIKLTTWKKMICDKCRKT